MKRTTRTGLGLLLLLPVALSTASGPATADHSGGVTHEEKVLMSAKGALRPRGRTTTTTIAATTTTTAPTTTTTSVSTTTTAPTTTTSTTAPPDAPPPTATHAVPTSIAADCSRPVDRELRSFFATVPDGATIAFASGGCYGYDGTIRVLDRNGLTFDGNGATFRALTDGSSYTEDTGNRMTWEVNGGSSITLREMVIRGAHPNGGVTAEGYGGVKEGQHGIGIGAVQGALVEDVSIFDVYGDFVAIQWDWRLWNAGARLVSSPPARDVTIRRLHAERNGRQGLFVGHGERVTLTDSFIAHTNQNHIDLEPDVAEHLAREIMIVNNRFGPVRFATLGNETGVAPLVGNVVFSGNTIDSPGTTCYPPVYVVGQAGNPKVGWTIEDNTITQLFFPGWAGAFSLTHARDISIQRNLVTGLSTAGGCSASVYGVRLTHADAATVKDNVFGGAQIGVLVETSTGISASGNTM